ncbi:MAG: RNA polymerase sigma factor FliA [Proteobacteria bacterium]|nr:RNA polymerase sigma factor FliA [Pseudomonadota bacterium]RTL42899.1 MAG: RNA polymerase sigma factor FliA [Rhodocyclaceae bacterium]
MYTASGTLDKEQLVVQYAPLVKRIAYHLMAKLPASVQVEDIIQNGMLGLLDAINRYEEGLGAQFETYAVQRVRGAMLDGLRENDWLPRSLRRDMRRIEAAVHQLEQQNGRPPTEKELADSLGLPLSDYQHMLQEARGYQLVYFEDFTSDGEDDYLERHITLEGNDPLTLLLEGSMRDVLVRAIDDLPEREQTVMGLYYEQDMNLREIGEVLGVSESRVCQLHSQAIARLRARISGVAQGMVKAKADGRARGRRPAAS